MPSGSSENQLDPTAQQHVAVGGRYGRAGFAAAVVNILLLEFLTWVFLLAWYMIPVIVLPAVIIDALVAYGLTRGRGTVAQVGRGMLIGCISAPLTVLILIPAFIIAKSAGLI